MKRLIPGILVLAAIAGLLLVAAVSVAVEVPVLGALALVLIFALAMMPRARHEPAPRLFDSRRWAPGGRGLPY